MQLKLLLPDLLMVVLRLRISLKTVPGTESVNAILTGTGGGIASDVTKVAAFGLSDFDTEGLWVDVKAIFTAGSSEWYRANVTGTLEDTANSDIGLGAGETLINRIRYNSNTNILILNDADVPSALQLRDHFGTGTTSNWTLYIQTRGGVASTDVLTGVGGSFANFRFNDPADRTLLANIGASDQFIIALARPIAYVESVIAGASGLLPSAAITKTSPGTESVNAILTGAVGVLSADIGKSAPGTESVSAVIAGTGGSLISDVTKVEPAFQLSDFDDTGLEVDAKALLVASGDGIWYADPNRNGSDSPTEGQLGLGANDTVITQILKAGNNVIRLNDNDVQADGTEAILLLHNHFGITGISDWVLYIQTASGIASSNQLDGTTGNGFVNFRFSGAADLAIINSIATGTRFIVTVARPSEAVSVEATMSGTGGDIAAQITKTSPGTESVETTLTGTGGLLSADITKVAALQLSDFDTTGLEIDALALLTIDDSDDLWYRNDFPDESDQGEITAGELGLNGDANTPITRIRLRGGWQSYSAQ